MNSELLSAKYHRQIKGSIGCLDRVLITGTIPQACYADGMRCYLLYKGIRIFDYCNFASQVNKQLRDNAEKLSKAHGVKILPLTGSGVNKEALAKAELKKREEEGEVMGLFLIISVTERCNRYKPQFDAQSNKSYLKAVSGRCGHYYFYFKDPDLGVCFLRVPRWLPCRLEFYFNGHNWLASKLDNEGIDYKMADNAFIDISDFQRAQEISSSLNIDSIHKKLDQYAHIYCPVHQLFNKTYHWSLRQVEYATDIVFRTQQDLQQIYPHLVRTAIHTVKPENITTFLGRKLHGLYQGEVGNKYNVRKEGSCIKHRMGNALIKMYDKFQQILRIEVVTNDVSFFQHYRKVEHRDGTTSLKFTSMKKNIYSLPALIKIMSAANRRYIQFISELEDDSYGRKRLKKITQRVQWKNRGYKGINFFDPQDIRIMETILRGEFNINGFRNKDIKKYLKGKNTGQISRIIKRLKVHGIIKRAGTSYKYYITAIGRKAAIAAMKIKEFQVIPLLK